MFFRTENPLRAVKDADVEAGIVDVEYKLPIICPDYYRRPTQWDKLENLVDVSDGFLMKAFEPFLKQENRSVVEEERKPGLFQM